MKRKSINCTNFFLLVTLKEVKSMLLKKFKPNTINGYEFDMD